MLRTAIISACVCLVLWSPRDAAAQTYVDLCVKAKTTNGPEEHEGPTHAAIAANPWASPLYGYYTGDPTATPPVPASSSPTFSIDEDTPIWIMNQGEMIVADDDPVRSLWIDTEVKKDGGSWVKVGPTLTIGGREKDFEWPDASCLNATPGSGMPSTDRHGVEHTFTEHGDYKLRVRYKWFIGNDPQGDDPYYTYSDEVDFTVNMKSA